MRIFENILKISAILVGLSWNIFAADYKVLILGGGGAAGMLALTALSSLEEATGKPTYQLFDEIWGASIGSLIAALLTTDALYNLEENRSYHDGEERRPISARKLLELLQRDVFGGYLPVGPKVLGYLQPLGIYNFVLAHLGMDAKLKPAGIDERGPRIPLPILVGEVSSFTRGVLTRSVNQRAITSFDNDATEISLADTVCASCNI